MTAAERRALGELPRRRQRRHHTVTPAPKREFSLLDCGMSFWSSAVAWGCMALEVLVLAGLIVRRRVRHCYTLTVLVHAWLGAALVAGCFPTLMTWDVWIATELAHALLALLVAVELAWRAFRPVPRAWWWSRVSIGVALATAVALVRIAWPGPLSVSVVPWCLGALACLYAGLWAIAGALALPQERLHQAVLGGLSPYLIVYAVTWGQARESTSLANAVNPIMFGLTLLVLAQAAWARDRALAAHSETVQWLFPWRS